MLTKLKSNIAQGHKNWVLTLAWSPDAKMLASGGMDGMVWLWSPEKGEPLGSCKVLRATLTLPLRSIRSCKLLVKRSAMRAAS